MIYEKKLIPIDYLVQKKKTNTKFKMKIAIQILIFTLKNKLCIYFDEYRIKKKNINKYKKKRIYLKNRKTPNLVLTGAPYLIIKSSCGTA